jgi:DNA-binding response OmpR family regulator
METANAEPTKQEEGKKKIVLYIEDEPELINLIKLILRRAGYEVIGATDGAEGLSRVRELKPDLVLLDLMLPVMSGWEVYWQMKADEELKNIPVIIVTVRAGLMDRRLALETAAVDGYVTKPFRPQDILVDISKVLSRE